MRKAFTLIELVVSVGILAIIMAFAGTIFKVGAESHRMAVANSEIMQKLRIITEQLNADFRGLRKEGEIFVVWEAEHASSDPNEFERFDRIMFFTAGDFQAVDANSVVRGDVARVCYTLASRLDGSGNRIRPEDQEPAKRMLMRTQHILVTSEEADDQFDVSSYTEDDIDLWRKWNSIDQNDCISLTQWRLIPQDQKINMLSVIGDITIKDGDENPLSTVVEEARGVVVDFTQINPVHALLAEGVGQFSVQGWWADDERWIPQVNPDGDPNLDDSDFLLDGSDIDPEINPGLWYPYGSVLLRDVNYPASLIDEAHFSDIPGLGRALKFTFTLYDSKGLIPDGRTFTHIVYLDD